MRKQYFFSGINTVLLICIMLISGISNMYGIKAYPGIVTIVQPDGTTLQLQKNGDEHYHYTTTGDGYLVAKNNTGYYMYATIDDQGKIQATSKVAKNSNQRQSSDVPFLMKMSEKKINGSISKYNKVKSAERKTLRKATPYVGAKQALVILVNFSDKSFSVPSPIAAFHSLLNESGYSANGGTGSAKDYFMASSYGKFIPQFDVVGPYILPQNMAYYGANNPNDNDNDVNPVQMIVDACTLANNNGVDFTKYDTNNDGYVDNVFVYYAGYNEAEWGAENTIWPHRWGVYPGYNYTGSTASVTFDGKVVEDYACTSELKGSSGMNMCGIGTFCHEFGHVLGLPDYYHTTEEDKTTLDDWSIMDVGAYLNEGRTPPAYSAYDRFYLGYSTPTEVKSPTEVVLYPLSQEKTTPSNFNNQAILLAPSNHNLDGESPSPAQFFVVEYRKKTGWDAYLPAEGLLIWHIDYNQTAWEDNSPNNYTGTLQTSSSHMRVYLHPLSGTSTTPGTAFTTGGFTPATWSGTDINRQITEITKTPEYMWFKVMDNVATAKINYGKVENNLTFPLTSTGATHSKNLYIKTSSITGNLSVVLSGADAGIFAVNTNTITQAAANAGYDLNVSYSPQGGASHQAILTISGGGLDPDKVINLSGSTE